MRLPNPVHAWFHGGFSTSNGVFRRPRVYELTSAIARGGTRRRRYDALIAAGGATDGDDVLDVGCGPGYLVKRLIRVVGVGGRIAGIDPSPEAIAYATRRVHGQADLRVASAEQLPFPDGGFDVVYCVLALHHVEPSNRPVALREMRRVLRPGGRLLVAEVHPRSAGDHTAESIGDMNTLIVAAGFMLVADGDGGHRTRYVAAERS